MEQVQKILANGWVKIFKGLWGSHIVLAAKPHQEHVTNIDNFIWRMCVSYQKLKGFTKPFQYTIPRYKDAVTVLNVETHPIWIITLDACQKYHQVAVRPVHQEILVVLCLLYQPMHLPYTHPWWSILIMSGTNYSSSVLKHYLKLI